MRRVEHASSEFDSNAALRWALVMFFHIFLCLNMKNVGLILSMFFFRCRVISIVILVKKNIYCNIVFLKVNK